MSYPTIITSTIEKSSSLRERFETSLAALRECSRVLLVEQQTLSDDDAISEVENDDIDYNKENTQFDITSSQGNKSTLSHSTVAGLTRTNSSISPRKVVVRTSETIQSESKHISVTVTDHSETNSSLGNTNSAPFLYPSLSPCSVARKLHLEAERMRLVLKEMTSRDREGIARELHIQGLYSSTSSIEHATECNELSSIGQIAADVTSSPESRTVRPLVRSILADLHGVANSLPTLRLLASNQEKLQKTMTSVTPSQSSSSTTEISNIPVVVPMEKSNIAKLNTANTIDSSSIQETATFSSSPTPMPLSSDQLIKRRPSLNPHFEWLRSRMRAVQQQPQLQQSGLHSSQSTPTTLQNEGSSLQNRIQISNTETTSQSDPSMIESSKWVPIVRIRGSSFNATDLPLASSSSSTALSLHGTTTDKFSQDEPVDADELSFIANSHTDHHQVLAVEDDAAIDTDIEISAFTQLTSTHAPSTDIISTVTINVAQPPISIPALPPLPSGTSTLAERAARVLHSSRPGSRASSRRNSFQACDALLPDSLHYSVGSVGSTRRNSLLCNNDNMLFRRNSITNVHTMNEMATQTSTMIDDTACVLTASGRRFSTKALSEPKETYAPQLLPSSIDNVAHVLRAAFVNARQNVASSQDKFRILNGQKSANNEYVCDDKLDIDVNNSEDDDTDTSILQALSSQAGISKGLHNYLHPSSKSIHCRQPSVDLQTSPPNAHLSTTIQPPPLSKPSIISSSLSQQQENDDHDDDDDDDDDDDFALSVLNGLSSEKLGSEKTIEFGWYIRENAPTSPLPSMIRKPLQNLTINSNVKQEALSISAFLEFDKDDNNVYNDAKDLLCHKASTLANDFENKPMFLLSAPKRPSTATGNSREGDNKMIKKKTKKVKVRKISTAVVGSRPAWKPTTGF